MSALISFYSANLALISPHMIWRCYSMYLPFRYFFFVKSSLAKYNERYFKIAPNFICLLQHEIKDNNFEILGSSANFTINKARAYHATNRTYQKSMMLLLAMIENGLNASSFPKSQIRNNGSLGKQVRFVIHYSRDNHNFL